METPLKNKLLSKLAQPDGMHTPVASSSSAGSDRSSRHITSATKLPSSPFLKKLGFGTGVEIIRIKRSPSKNSNKSPWAIKMLSRRANAEQMKMFGDRLTEEANILKTLNHPNIVGFRSFDTLEAGKEFIAMEYCNISLGDLLQQRYEQVLGPLEAPKIQSMALDILNALDYLHTEALILHGDLKSFNILVKDDFAVCKLCDFGVSLPLTKEGFLDTEKKKDAQYVGTGIWSAPEVLEEDVSLISSKADIFSFGLVVYETITLLPPHTFPGMKDESIASSADYAVMKSIIRGNSANPVSRKLNVSEVIVLDDTEEKDTLVANRGNKRKSSNGNADAPVSKKSAPEPDSTTDTHSTVMNDDGVVTIADESIDKSCIVINDSVVTVEDDTDLGEDGDELDDDEEDYDEDEEGDYLDYGLLGTRPAIPDSIELSDEYNFILEVFYVCTQEDYEARPSARILLNSWQKRVEGSVEVKSTQQEDSVGENKS